jgi:hypothetical protein
VSTIKTTNIQHASATNPAIVLDASGGMSGSFPSPNRNLLYNGAMQVAQRGTTSSGNTTGGYFTADRWKFNISSFGTWTQTVENDAPTGSGFRKSLKVLCTAADAAPAGADYGTIIQHLEGQDLQRIAKGTASAQQLTLSFWVKSNLTGTYSVMFYDVDNARFTSFTYSISASATWEKKTIIVPADTTGAFDNDNGDSFQLYFNLGSGSTYTGGSAQTTWSGGTAFGTQWMPSQVNLAATTSNYWQVTGVQLEVGPVATPFEFKSFGQELTACLRYLYMFQNSEMSTGSQRAFAFASNTNMMRAVIPFPVRMRTEPTLVSNSGTNYFVFYDGVTQDYFNALTINASGLLSAEVYSDSNVAATQFRPGHFYTANASAYVGFNADF